MLILLRHARSFVLFVLIASRCCAAPVMQMHCIDVGQGASELFEFPCGAILIDTGAADQKHTDMLVDYLHEFFARRTDLNDTLAEVIVTHPHKDHAWGLPKVAQNFKILNYVDDGEVSSSGRPYVQWIRDHAHSLSIPIREIRDDEITALPNRKGLTDKHIDPLKCDDCDPKIVVLSGGLDENPGWSETDFENPNNHSVVVRIDFGKSSFLVTGDLQKPAIETMVDYYRGTSMLDVDVYICGHHGSVNATTQSLIDAMTPKMAVINVGQWNDGEDTPSNIFTTFAYGHPRKEVLDLLSDAIADKRETPMHTKAGVHAREFVPYTVTKAVYATGWDGNVVIQADLNGVYKVEMHRTRPVQPAPLIAHNEPMRSFSMPRRVPIDETPATVESKEEQPAEYRHVSRPCCETVYVYRWRHCRRR